MGSPSFVDERLEDGILRDPEARLRPIDTRATFRPGSQDSRRVEAIHRLGFARARLQAAGLSPTKRRNSLVKWGWSARPHSAAISLSA
jgi:hypothetical protein